jgi:hypothetical protein
VRKRCRKSGRACARLEGWGGPNASRRRLVRRRAEGSKPPHPEERACGKAAANQVARARVSKDEDGGTPLMLRDGGSFGDERRARPSSS